MNLEGFHTFHNILEKISSKTSLVLVLFKILNHKASAILLKIFEFVALIAGIATLFPNCL